MGGRRIPVRMAISLKPSLPVLLSFTGGYVDTAGFLALQGLFAAHVTGNFVTIAAALVFGTSGVATKLLALPVFCLSIITIRLARYGIARRNWPILPTILSLKFALLCVGTVLAICLGPFRNGDSWQAMLTGMTFVAAMAVQNALHRVHLSGLPPSTVMTSTVTQLMIDIADWLRGLAPEQRDATRTRMRHMSSAVASFAIGAASAASLFSAVSIWCFAVTPLAALAARWLVTSEDPVQE